MTATNGTKRQRPLRANGRDASAPAPVGGHDAVEAIEDTRDSLRRLVRSTIGFDETANDSLPLAEGIHRSGMGWYPLIALGLLVIVDQFQSFGFTVLGPEIADALGLNKSSLAALLALKTLALTLAALPMAAIVQRRARRGVLSVVTGLGWGVITVAT